MSDRKWIVSYDNVPQIRRMYLGRTRITYGVGYSARTVRRGDEVMFFSEGMRITPILGAMHALV